MGQNPINHSIFSKQARLLTVGLLFLGLCLLGKVQAHPMPNSLLLLNIQQSSIRLTLRVPVQEFVLAFYRNNQSMNRESLIRDQMAISRYFLQHCALESPMLAPWIMKVEGLKLETINSELNGVYQELLVEMEGIPPLTWKPEAGIALKYDAVIHQVVTHFAVVKISQSFRQGIIPAHPVEIGLIQLDIASNQVKPLSIHLESGNSWKGFYAMVQLGISHIQEGFDHLLYLLLVLLVAPLRSEAGRWTSFGGSLFTAKRVGWLLTSFTFGHSISLLLVALFPIPRFIQWIEVGIGLTLLMAAFHAWRPIFGKNEILLTWAFGLIHGAAFASTLYDLHLPLRDKLLSVLGFNIGIELMQGMLALLFIPLIYFSKQPIYQKIRPAIAFFAALAAGYWIVDRL